MKRFKPCPLCLKCGYYLNYNVNLREGGYCSEPFYCHYTMWCYAANKDQSFLKSKCFCACYSFNPESQTD